MKHLIQTMLMLIAFSSFANDQLPIYDHVIYSKDFKVGSSPDQDFIPSIFAKPDLLIESGFNIGNRKISKIIYLYSHNNINEGFHQSSLSEKRYNNLKALLGEDAIKGVKWETQVQIGCGTIECSEKLDHGFIIEYESLKSFKRSNLKEQTKEVTANVHSEITGANGTKIEIPANAFVDAFGNPVTGKVNIKLTEAVSLEDIVIGGLTTRTSDGGVLESKGMINVQAYQGNNQLYLKKDITVTLPTDFEEGFSYYEGEIENGDLVWKNPIDLVPNGFQSDTMEVEDDVKVVNDQPAVPVFEISDDFDMIVARDMVGFGATRASYGDKKLLEVIVYKEGKRIKISDRRVSDDKWLIHRGLNEEEVAEVQGWFENDSVPMLEQGWVIRNENMNQNNNQRGKIVMNNNVEGMNLNHFTDNKLANTFKMKNLGWANVDCLAGNRGAKKIELAVAIEGKPEKMDEFNISLVVPSRNIFIQGYKKKDGNYSFTHGDYEKQFMAPVGKTAYIVALGNEDGQTYFAKTEISLGEFPVERLKLNKTEESTAIKEIKNTF